MSLSGYDVEQRVLRGENSVYPGHPLTVGLLIMEHYPDLDSARAKTTFGWPEAVGNGDIPGAGGEVYAALDMLVRIRDGLQTPEEAIDAVKHTWHAGGIKANVVPAQEQADRFADDYLNKVKPWCGLVSAPTP